MCFLFWQTQVDFNLPQRFDITYVDTNSDKKRPIMIHRAVLGSLERFLGFSLNTTQGIFHCGSLLFKFGFCPSQTIRLVLSLES